MANQDLQIIIDAKDTSSAEFRKVTGSLDDLGRQSTLVEGGISKLSLALKATAAGAVAALGASIIGAVKETAKFEQQMSDVATLISGDSTEAIDTLETGINELLRTVPKSADELGAASYQIVSAGIADTSDALRVLEASAKLGVAGLGTTEAATNLLTSALNAFQLPVEQADQAADILFKTVKAGKTTVDELSQSFGQVAPVAVAAGVTLEELQGATAALTTTGLQTSVAQTQLKALFTEMTREGGTLGEAIKGLGIENVKTAIETDGFSSVLFSLKESVGGNEVAFKNMFSSVEAAGAALSITGAQEGAFTSTTMSMLDTTNAMNEAFEKQNQTTDAQFKLLKNELNIALRELGSVILPILVDAMKTVRPIISELSQKFKENEEQIRFALLVMKEAAAVVKDILVVAFQVAVTQFESVFEIVFKVVDAFKSVKDAIVNATNAVKDFFDSDAGSVFSILPGINTGGVVGKGGKIHRFAAGGVVPGFGNQDRVPALLTPGEVVLNPRRGQLPMTNVTINFNGGMTLNKEADENRLVEKIKQSFEREAHLDAIGAR